jgi:hypothetical protein
MMTDKNFLLEVKYNSEYTKSMKTLYHFIFVQKSVEYIET